MINVSRNGIKAIMKMTQLSIYKKQDENVASEPTAKSDQAHAPLRSACTTGPKPTLRTTQITSVVHKQVKKRTKKKDPKNNNMVILVLNKIRVRRLL